MDVGEEKKLAGWTGAKVQVWRELQTSPGCAGDCKCRCSRCGAGASATRATALAQALALELTPTPGSHLPPVSDAGPRGGGGGGAAPVLEGLRAEAGARQASLDASASQPKVKQGLKRSQKCQRCPVLNCHVRFHSLFPIPSAGSLPSRSKHHQHPSSHHIGSCVYVAT